MPAFIVASPFAALPIAKATPLPALLTSRRGRPQLSPSIAASRPTVGPGAYDRPPTRPLMGYSAHRRAALPRLRRSATCLHQHGVRHPRRHAGRRRAGDRDERHGRLSGAVPREGARRQRARPRAQVLDRLSRIPRRDEEGRGVPGVVGVAPFVINPMMVTHGDRTATGVLLKGVDPDRHAARCSTSRSTSSRGSLAGLRRAGAQPPERPPDSVPRSARTI